MRQMEHTPHNDRRWRHTLEDAGGNRHWSGAEENTLERSTGVKYTKEVSTSKF